MKRYIKVIIIGIIILKSLHFITCLDINQTNDQEILSKLDVPVDPYQLIKNGKFEASITKWDFLDTKRKFPILSMVVDHHSDGSWYMPSLHDKYSVGWNRTVEKGFMNRPYGCNIRFFGVGLESTLAGFEDGGTGYLIIGSIDGRYIWHGIDGPNNETSKVHCYYQTNKNHPSDFIDRPKTYALVVYCPITLDQEIGLYGPRLNMHPGFFCRVLSDWKSKTYLRLRPSNFRPPPPDVLLPKEDPREIEAEFSTSATVTKNMQIKRISKQEHRPHAVCTVQTFRNSGSGPMLYMFVKYYLRMGWSVIVYDRFGLHKEYLAEIINLHGFYYFPYTVYQLVQPKKYSLEYAKKQGFGNKYYYKMEKMWVKGYGNNKADTADQDQDKTRTYDYSRLEFSHMETMLYLDADEFFYCPQEEKSISNQREYQQYLLDRFVLKGIEEMRYSRMPYAGLAPRDINNTADYRAHVDLTETTQECMRNGFESRDELSMFRCWSNASTYDDFGKSADMASICPFHYNHWSCTGMRGGGGNWGKLMCRCKVAFDMTNQLTYRPVLDRCHLLHFNDNKYRFQLIRSHGRKGIKKQLENMIFEHDNGNITEYSPIAKLYTNLVDGNSTSKFHELDKIQSVYVSHDGFSE